MKKVLFIFAVLFVSVLTSCNKEEVVIPIDPEAIRTAVQAADKPETQEIIDFASGYRTKAAYAGVENPLPVVMVFSLDARTIQINGNKATRYFLVYEFQGNTRTKEITVTQVFTIKADGSIDPTSGELQEAMPGCPWKSEFFVLGDNNYQGVTQVCNFKDGRQISFIGQLINNHTVKLPPLEGGVWQLKLGYFDGDFYQEFTSKPINFYGPTNEVGLKIEISKDNIKSYVQIPKAFLKNANYVQIFAENIETGEITSYIEFTPVYDEALPEYIAYGVPFEMPTRVNIWTPEYRASFMTNPVLNTQINGKPVYRAE